MHGADSLSAKIRCDRQRRSGARLDFGRVGEREALSGLPLTGSELDQAGPQQFRVPNAPFQRMLSFSKFAWLLQLVLQTTNERKAAEKKGRLVWENL